MDCVGVYVINVINVVVADRSVGIVFVVGKFDRFVWLLGGNGFIVTMDGVEVTSDNAADFSS